MQTPTHLRLHKATRILEIAYGHECFQLSAEFLRVHSPSAEVQGHGHPKLQYGKQQVALEKLEPVGRYAVRLIFDDGHDTGLYSWEYLEYLSRHQESLWKAYLHALHQAGKSRDADTSIIQLS